jgi:dTDP-4-dehydrorhamnose reductase
MKIVIVGSGGRLGSALMREYSHVASASQPMIVRKLGLGSPSHEFDVIGFAHSQLDLANPDQLRDKIGDLDFDVLINAAAMTDVDLCEKQPDRAFQVNAESPRVLAEICAKKKARLIHFSTDYVFDGEKREPYTEEDEARPISIYGESKRAGEKLVLQTKERHLVVRVSWVFGPERPSFIDTMIKRARESEHVDAIADKFSTPTYTRDIAEMLAQFFMRNAVAGVADPGREAGKKAGLSDPGYRGSGDYSGILHFANAGECSWQEYAQFALDTCRSLGIPLKARAVAALQLSEMKNWVARRPPYSVLSTEKFFSLTGATPRNWRDAVAEYVREFVVR